MIERVVRFCLCGKNRYIYIKKFAPPIGFVLCPECLSHEVRLGRYEIQREQKKHPKEAE